MSGSGISRAICKYAPRSRQITMPAAPQHSSFFYRPDALPADQPTVSKHLRNIIINTRRLIKNRHNWAQKFSTVSPWAGSERVTGCGVKQFSILLDEIALHARHLCHDAFAPLGRHLHLLAFLSLELPLHAAAALHASRRRHRGSITVGVLQSADLLQ